MRPIANKANDTVIMIEVTNVCNRACCNCVRFCGHYRKDKIFYVDPEDVRKYLKALRDFPHFVGFIGGEPTLHPQFVELCHIMRDYRPKAKTGIWTNTLTPQFRAYRGLIEDTFYVLNYNDHTTNITHTPVLTVSGEVVADATERDEINSHCWLQETWSATITPKGAYFCEVAAMLAWLLDGPDGWDATDAGWWKKDIPEYREQMEWACKRCGAALPLVPRSSREQTDDVSPGMLKELIRVGSPKVLAGKYEIYNKGFKPGQNRKRDWYWNHE